MPANILFEKDGAFDTVFYQYALGMAELERFAQFCQAYSLAKVARIAMTDIKDTSYGSEQTGDFGNVRLAARLRFYCTAEQKMYGCNVQAPKADMFNDDNSVKQSVGERFAQEYSHFTGKTVTYRDGWLIGDTTPAPH
jgi:hypothetical protein